MMARYSQYGEGPVPNLLYVAFVRREDARSSMAPILPTLVIAIVVVGLLHLIGAHYSGRRKRRAALARLRVRVPDARP